ncbi:hypothetical protein [Paenibacillus xylanexedens]|uniref:hypothetical protein n=1 Tax=Paenibacillus xylanexedens TaxID=528191 RepID=UPI0011A745BF|nr:hypothetical protein [Paenibacillus xylanexedens]
MKAVPKVNTDGLYLEDELVDDAFSGVVPFYADPEPVVFNPEAPEQPAGPEIPDDEEEVEREIAGYIVGVPVPAGLYLPKFDLKGWEAHLEEEVTARTEYQSLYDAWLQLPEEEKEEAPQYVGPELSDLWVEGLSQEEIDELTKPQPTEPTELDRLGEQLVQRELEALELKQQNEILGQQIVMRELEGADLKAQNEALGGQIVGLELRVLTVETQSKGDEANV